MFDGLKDTLGRFKRDVEEEVDEGEPSEGELDEEEIDREGVEGEESEEGLPPESEASAESEIETDIEASEQPDASTEEGVAEPETGTDRTVERPGSEAETVAADADIDADAEPVAESEPATEDAPEEGPGPSFGTRAMAFATGQAIIHEEDLEDPLWDLEMALLESDVELSVAESILEGIRERLANTRRAQVKSTGMVVEDALGEALLDVISVGQFDFDGRVAESEKPLVITFTGVNGVGKTTSIAKLARYFEQRGLSTVLANGDTYRAGANEQIEAHADRLGRKLISHDSGGDPAAVLYDGLEYAHAQDIDVVLGDTAGRLHTSNDLMTQLEKIDRVVDPDMTLFVDEAVAGQDAVRRAEEFDDAASIDGTILTKADADSQGGAAISIAHVTGKPIVFLGTGQGYDDLERFEPEQLVDRLLSEG
ncbi:signal recognition particle-docking protein FtsY [Halobacteriales archaeon QS_3_64_16]|nr:MAG: signal recognition particle-docking protein FtsY [Halobacteriales archaeon QS_3_64_16]